MPGPVSSIYPGPKDASIPTWQLEQEAIEAGWYKCVGGEFTKIVSGLQYVASDAQQALDTDAAIAAAARRFNT